MLRFLVIPSLVSFAHAELPDTVDFNDHVQPILSENCYHCHGPDSSTRAPKKNPLRLDREEYAFLARPSGQPTIIKGDPEASEFIKRITTKDSDDVMPPPDSHKNPLKPNEVALLKKWIKQGATYEEHWAFIPPVRAEVPKSDWGQNVIDKFISTKLQSLHLKPNKPAQTYRLIRRLTFDLTGLPPTPEEVSAFEAEAAIDLAAAMKSATKRLLKSDRYAEHFGRHWLDAARYADTHGIHIDNYRSIWPYRDWVIEAFRKNMPFDQFTREQIAGDLMPNASLEQKIATGFNRCLPTTGEGGAIAKEYEAIYAKDRVETTSAIWLGLTTGCAACHDHKFDPISQKDFYSMAAYFRNTTMHAMDLNSAQHPPSLFAPRQDDRPEWNSLTQQISDVEKAIAKRREAAELDYQNWMTSQGTTPAEDLSNDPEIHLPLVVKDGKISGSINGEQRFWDYRGPTKDRESVGKITKASGNNVDLGEIAIFDARDQVSFGGYLFVGKGGEGPIISRMNERNSFRGWDLWLEGGKFGSHIVDQWPAKAIKAVTKSPLKRGQWHHVMITYDGKADPKKSLTIYIDGKVTPINYSHAGRVNTLLTNVPTRLGARHPNSRARGQIFFHGFQMFKHKLTAEEVQLAASKTNINALLAVPVEERDKKQTETIYEYYMSKIDGPTLDLASKKQSFIDKKNKLRGKGSITLVMEEKKGEAFAHILERGEYSLEKDKVLAAIPELFAGDKKGQRKSRKELADWLVSEKNPLTARVTVNRLWYYFFGRGLVETTEDFGIMGARPTHPELLDYLAMEFMKSGWDMQHIMKLITESSTYQLSAKVTSQHREKDPTNLYLARSPRHRLEAEQIRDLALSTSGLLINKVGGPPAKPYQPEGIWEAVAMKQSDTKYYKQDTGEGLYRRSVYTFWKRTAAPPNMEILNAPTREVFCVRRDRTNTPLQAFVTLNDTQFIESARQLASRAIKAHSSFQERLDFITNNLMSRTLDDSEKATVKKAFDHHLKRYNESTDLAEKLITVGESKPDSSLNKSELATWTLVTSQIFNLDETLTK